MVDSVVGNEFIKEKNIIVAGDLYMMKDGIVKVPYARILIKKKREL